MPAAAVILVMVTASLCAFGAGFLYGRHTAQATPATPKRRRHRQPVTLMKSRFPEHFAEMPGIEGTTNVR